MDLDPRPPIRRLTGPTLGLLLLALAPLPGCMIGVQQLVAVPSIHGDWQFTGAEFTATTAPDASGASATVPVDMGPGRGRIDSIYSMTQIVPLFGIDLPFLRMSPSIGITGDSHVDYIQMDLLYKHALTQEDDPRWRLLAGFSLIVLEARVQQESVLVLEQPVSLGGGTVLNPGDAVVYQATEMLQAWSLAVGLEYEIYHWLHVYAQVNALFAETRERGEDLQITAREGAKVDDDGNREAETIHVLSDARFDVTGRPGLFTSTLEMPDFTALVGIAVTFPTPEFFRGKRRRPPPPPPDYVPPPPVYGEHPPEGYPSPDLPR